MVVTHSYGCIPGLAALKDLSAATRASTTRKAASWA
jgi:hypothetical protein